MIKVQTLFDFCHVMLKERWGYIWGAYGQIWTEEKQRATTNEMAQRYGAQWIGHHVADCSGVMVYIWNRCDMSIYHGSNTIQQKHVGKLSKEPKPGYAAFKVKGDDYYHIGIVDETAKYVYESRSTKDGFCHDSPVSKWDYFAPFNDIIYEGYKMDEILYKAVVDTNGGPLNVRVAPGVNSRIVDRIPKGKVVEVYKEDGTWALCRYGEIEGWCARDYLKRIGEETNRYGVFIPCDSQAEAEKIASCFKGAEVQHG